MSLQPWQERVVEERAQLAERLTKLDEYLANRNALEPMTPDMILLVRQQTAMKVYLEILDERIKRFSNGT